MFLQLREGFLEPQSGQSEVQVGDWHALNPRMGFSLSGLAEVGPVAEPLCQIAARAQASRARQRRQHLQPSERLLSAAHQREQNLQLQHDPSRTWKLLSRTDSRVSIRAALAEQIH